MKAMKRMKKRRSLIDYDGADDDEAGKDDENSLLEDDEAAEDDEHSLLDNAAPGSGTMKAMNAMKAMKAMKRMKKKRRSLIDYDGADDDEAGKDDENSLLEDDEAAEDDENSLLDNAAPGSGTKKAMKAMNA